MLHHPARLTAQFAMAAAFALSMAAPAFADAAGAAACAKGLSPESQEIFNASAPDVTSGTSIRDALHTHTYMLMKAGQVSRGTAKVAATATVSCLKMLKN